MSEQVKGIKQIAHAAGYGIHRTREMIQSGDIPAWQDLPDPAWRISQEALREWVRERERAKRAVQ